MTGTELIAATLTAISETDAVFHPPAVVTRQLESGELFLGLTRALSELTVTFPLTANQAIYALHPIVPRFVFPQRVTINKAQIFPAALSHITAVDPSWRLTTGTPRRYAMLGATHVIFYPVPNQAFTANLICIAVPPPWPVDAAPSIGAEWGESLISYSAALLLAKEGRLEDATAQLGQFMTKTGLVKDKRFSPPETKGKAAATPVHEAARAEEG